uniref:Uncharacterized protein n=1 Tax=Oryza punctata TaxID=4537 RepID=A0A0E0K001_ORYPU
MEQLLFVGLDTTEPPEPQQEEENGGSGGEKDLPVSVAGFVDRLHMRRMIQAFFHPELVDMEDEGKDTRSDRNLIGNFMAATGFVNRLWDARRIIAVCRDSNMDDAARKATAVGMLRRLEELLNGRAKAFCDTPLNANYWDPVPTVRMGSPPFGYSGVEVLFEGPGRASRALFFWYAKQARLDFLELYTHKASGQGCPRIGHRAFRHHVIHPPSSGGWYQYIPSMAPL